jgi:kynureninase
MFVAAEHQPALRTPLPGWHGHADPFAMSAEYRPAAGIGQLANGTPPVLSLLALEDAVNALAGVSTADLRAKSAGLTGLFIDLVTNRCSGIEVVTPVDADRRGSQVSLRLGHAYSLVRALIERGVIGDFRAPDIARFGFAPAYSRYVDVWDAVESIVDVLTSGDHLTDRFVARPAVT